MGLGSTVGGLALLLIVVLVFWSQLTTVWSDFTAGQQASQQAKNLAPPITKGSTVCNLKVTVISQLTSNLFSPNPDNLKVVTTHYNWFGCRTVTSQLSLIQVPPPYIEKFTNGYGSGLPLFDFALLSPTNIPVSLVLTNTLGQQYDSNLLPALTQNIHVPAGLVKEPYSSTLVYLITNIPRSDYKASLSSGTTTIEFTNGQLPVGASVNWEIFGAKDSQ